MLARRILDVLKGGGVEIYHTAKHGYRLGSDNIRLQPIGINGCDWQLKFQDRQDPVVINYLKFTLPCEELIDVVKRKLNSGIT